MRRGRRLFRVPRRNSTSSANPKLPDSTRESRAAGDREARGAHPTAIGALLFHDPRTRRVARWVVAAVGLVVLAVAAVFFLTDFEWRDVAGWINWDGVMQRINRLEPALVIPAMAVLPIFGFPVSVVYLIAGARFGPLWGGVVVTIATATHLLGAFGITRSVLRRPLQRFVDRRHKRLPEIPEDEQVSVALIAALVPGVPYVVRLYLLALADLRLRIYFWVCLIVYVLRSYVTILVGDLGSEPSGRRLIILLGVDGLKLVICALLIWRLRVHHQRFHGPERGPGLKCDSSPGAR